MRALAYIATTLALVALGGCGGGDDNSPREVEYIVSSANFFRDRAAITYSSSSGSTSQTTATLPWSFTRTAEPGDFLYVSAQNLQTSGSVTVSIYIDGKRARSASANGGFSIATASTSCCTVD